MYSKQNLGLSTFSVLLLVFFFQLIKFQILMQFLTYSHVYALKMFINIGSRIQFLKYVFHERGGSKFEKQYLNCLIDIVLVLDCSTFRSDDCLQIVYCSTVFVNCIDLHLSVLLHTFVLSLRLELKSKAQDLIQGKRSRFSRMIMEFHVLFLGKFRGKKSNIVSESCILE